tara:strand:+ start:130 stop:504 length:375 start_codon:yes stop_codon:yes gene_type:complete
MNKYVFLIIFSVLANFISLTQFKSLATDLPVEAEILAVFEVLIFNCKLYVGLLFFGLSSILWIFGLKGLSLTKAYTILSLNYVLILGYSYMQLQEEVSISRICAAFLIILGIIIINSKTNSSKQ